MYKLKFQEIYCFLTLAETLNFTLAAQRLFISQPALSKQIRQLEQEIDVQLLRRDTKKVELTAAGRIMCVEWTKLLADTEQAINRARQENIIWKKNLKIGIAECAGIIDYATLALATFTAQSPHFELDYEIYGFSQLRKKLKANELDLIFSFDEEVPSSEEGFQSQRLLPLELNIIMGRNCPLYEKADVTVEDLADQWFCLMANSYSDEAQRKVLQHCELHGFHPANTRTYPNITSLSVALSSGVGVTISYKCFFMAHQEISQKLRFIPIEPDLTVNCITMTWKKSKTDQIQSLLDFVREKTH